jgi:hypothetical protein
MKKQLLTLSFALLGAGYLMAAVGPDSSASNLDTARAHANIWKMADATAAPVLDGVADDAVWGTVPANKIDRQFKGEHPTLYSAQWKATWCDSAIFILVQVEDNDFWPSWKSTQPDWASDKIELYFDVNGSAPTAYGASTGGPKGLYQVTSNWDTIQGMGTAHKGNFDSTYEACHWTYDAATPLATRLCPLTVEWSVPFAKLRDSNAYTAASWGSGIDPTATTKIGFDICVSDLDSAGPSGRQRQMWSNTAKGFAGNTSENWGRMDSVGIVTFVPTPYISVRQITSEQNLVSPTVVSDVLNVNGETLDVYNMLGQLVYHSNVNNGKVNVSTLHEGIYVAVVNKKYSTKIIKK